jgi:methyl-accepting chemotaxis protein
MKTSIRTKFSIGMVFLFVIIAILSIYSGVCFNKLANKTKAILKENHLSVVYARDMSEFLMNINQEITTNFLNNKECDSSEINSNIIAFGKSLKLEKANITEDGEDKLASEIETGFQDYCIAALEFTRSQKANADLILLQKKHRNLLKQLTSLSQMNSKAIEDKTNEAKVYAQIGFQQISILGVLCFLVALSFIYSFSTYFNNRFSQLFNGIKEIVSSNYGQRLYFDGKDEFYEISLLFNQMAEKLSEKNVNTSSESAISVLKDQSLNDIKDLKQLIQRIKIIEEQANSLVSKIENKR